VLGAVGVDAEQESVNTFSLSCRDASLRSVLASLSIQKGINIAGLDRIDSGLTVTIHLESVAVSRWSEPLSEVVIATNCHKLVAVVIGGSRLSSSVSHLTISCKS